MSANGRLLPTGKWTTDIDFDGKPDDPGINGVKVELLTKKGYSVNVNGEAVIADRILTATRIRKRHVMLSLTRKLVSRKPL